MWDFLSRLPTTLVKKLTNDSSFEDEPTKVTPVLPTATKHKVTFDLTDMRVISWIDQLAAEWQMPWARAYEKLVLYSLRATMNYYELFGLDKNKNSVER